MKIYQIIIRSNLYPTEYTVQASSMATAVAEGIREWTRHFKDKRKGNEINIRVLVGGKELLKANGEEKNL